MEDTYPHFTHGTTVIRIGGNDDVHVFNDTLESLIEFFSVQLQLKESTVHFVHEQDGLDTFGDGLTQYSFSLYAHT